MSRPWPRAVLFDLDGTLIDSLPDIAGALNDLMDLRGLPRHPSESVRRMIGKGVAVLVQRGFAAHGIVLDGEVWAGEVRAYLDLYEPRATLETKPYPTVIDTLRMFAEQDVAMGVCTNKPTAISREILERFGLLDYCPTVIGGDHGPARKPAPDLVLATVRLMGFEPAEAVMVGDSDSDVLAAKAADMPVVAVDYGYSATPARDLGADACISRLSELPTVLLQLGEARHERA